MINMAIYENQKISEHIFMHESIKEANISLNEELAMLKDNFKLLKIKFFDAQGVVRASTDLDDIGKKTPKSILSIMLKKGKSFLRLFKKGR